MKLRVVSGVLKGRVLTIPQRHGVFRPTRERVRESVADILASRIAGATVADVCAGSGSVGFEMISRGAARAVFVENDRIRGTLIRKHAERFGVIDLCRIVMRKVAAFIDGCSDRFDIIYYDPPYDNERMAEALPSLLELLAERGILVYERSTQKARRTREQPDGMPQPFDRRRYGETEICLFTNHVGAVREPPLLKKKGPHEHRPLSRNLRSHHLRAY
ncbi:MAG: RsmD family RNA methyltransferase [Chitinispirillaceae bacterium]|nr:RsmD family RNA methyltransferase [Chitinispirillaceae bacterium]